LARSPRAPRQCRCQRFVNETNDYQIFAETFEGEAFVGIEAVHITMNLCPDGSSSATVDISPCTTGS